MINKIEWELEEGILGNSIRTARIKKGLPQEQLAELAGITPTHLKHIESEHRKPSIEVMNKAHAHKQKCPRPQPGAFLYSFKETYQTRYFR